jgi:hypothetical protein
MITPEESAQFARIKESYREWLERARRESDERRAAQRRPRYAAAPPGGGRERTEPMGDRGR